MATFTTNYKLIKPTPNSPIDADVWGGQLNEQTIDTVDNYLLKTATSNISNTAPAVPELTAGLAWIDKNTDSETAWYVKIYDGTTWVLTGTLNPTTNQYRPAGVTTTSINVQTFTASGTYTPTPGLVYAMVRMVGGGAGGANPGVAAGGGGSGGYSEGIFTIAQLGETQVVTVGMGGGAAANGTATSLGTLLTANGGFTSTESFGQNDATFWGGGPGGDIGTGASGAYLLLPGETGGPGWYMSEGGSGGRYGFTGCGGNGQLGRGGRNQILSNNTTNGTGQAGAGYGAGGAGGWNPYTSGGAGGAGAPGVVIITEYISS